MIGYGACPMMDQDIKPCTPSLEEQLANTIQRMEECEEAIEALTTLQRIRITIAHDERDGPVMTSLLGRVFLAHRECELLVEELRAKLDKET